MTGRIIGYRVRNVRTGEWTGPVTTKADAQAILDQATRWDGYSPDYWVAPIREKRPRKKLTDDTVTVRRETLRVLLDAGRVLLQQVIADWTRLSDANEERVRRAVREAEAALGGEGG